MKEIPLKNKSVSGSHWIICLQTSVEGLKVIKFIILARLLTPVDFGLFGIALLVIGFTETFSETGFRHALVQKKGNVPYIEDYFDTAWSINILRAVILTILVIGIGPFIVEFFKEDKALFVIYALSLTILIKGFENIYTLTFVKEFDYKQQFIYQFIWSSIEFLSTILLAVILRNVWALIYGIIIGTSVKVLTSYLVTTNKPKFRIKLDNGLELIRYGRWILGSNIFGYLGAYIDNIVVGRLLGTEKLGLYTVGYRISQLVVFQLNAILNITAFPAFSKIQGNNNLLKENFQKLLSLTSVIMFPLFSFLIFFTFESVQVVLGNKWLSIIPVIKILAFAGLIKSFVAVVTPLFYASGYPQYGTYCQIIRGSTLALFIIPVVFYFGIVGACYAVFASSVATAILSYVYTKNIINISCKDLIKAIRVSAIGSLIVVLVIYIVRDILFKHIGINPMETSSAVIVIGVGVLFFVCYFLAIIKWFSTIPGLAELRLLINWRAH